MKGTRCYRYAAFAALAGLLPSARAAADDPSARAAEHFERHNDTHTGAGAGIEAVKEFWLAEFSIA